MSLKFRMDDLNDGKPMIDVNKIERGLKNAVRDEAADGTRFMQKYPPQKPTKYVRTGILRYSWSFIVKVTLNFIGAVIRSQKNIAPYNEFVQGENQTSVMDSKGWHDVNDLEEKIQRDFPKRVQKEINRGVSIL